MTPLLRMMKNSNENSRKLLLHAKRGLTNILVKYHYENGDLESAFGKEMRNSEFSYPNLVTYSTLMDDPKKPFNCLRKWFRGITFCLILLFTMFSSIQYCEIHN